MELRQILFLLVLLQAHSHAFLIERRGFGGLIVATIASDDTTNKIWLSGKSDKANKDPNDKTGTRKVFLIFLV